MHLVDTHTHINLKAFAEDGEEILRLSLQKGLTLVNVGTDFSTSQTAVQIAEKYDQGVYATVGLHPSHAWDNPYLDTNESTVTINREIFNYEEYKKLAQNPKVVGIGECGLDYYRLTDYALRIADLEEVKSLQREAFKEQIQLARELDKALVVHCRPSEETTDAYEEVLEILKSEIRNPKQISNHKSQIINSENSSLRPHFSKLPIRFEIHSYTGNWETARKFLELGGYLGFNGIITFDKTGVSAEVVRNVPLDRILLETDAPYLAPVPFRGKRNQPLYLEYVAQKIAEIKGLEYDKVVTQTTENAQHFFKII